MPRRGYFDEGYTGTLWKLNTENFENITSSPIGSDIYQLGIKIPFEEESIPKKIKEIIERNEFHKELIKKIAGFLKKRGSYLVTGFRGVGKSSVVNSSIAEYIYSENEIFKERIKKKIQTEKDIGHQEMERAIEDHEGWEEREEIGQKIEGQAKNEKLYPIVISIPMEQSIERLSIIKMIFSEICSHPKVEEHLTNAIEKKDCDNCPEKENYFIALEDKFNALNVGTNIEKIQREKLSELTQNENFNSIREIRINPILASASISKDNPIETDHLRIQSSSHLVHDLKDFINLLAQSSEHVSYHFKFIFVFDELDRLKGQDESVEERSPEKSEIYLMEILVSQLKVLFTQTDANFIFIAGVDMYEKWQFEKSRGDGLYEGLFSENFYVHSLLTKGPSKVDLNSNNSNENSDSGLDELLDNQYLNTYGHKYHKNEEKDCQKFSDKPNDLKKASQQKDDSIPPDTPGKDTESSPDQQENELPDPEEKENRIYTFLRNIFLVENGRIPGTARHYNSKLNNGPTIMLDSFCRYLKFKSRGILRKLIRELNNYIIFDDGHPYISIPENESMKIKFFSGIEKLIDNKLPFNYQTNDINKVLIYFVIDCSFKFYRDGLNIEDWEAFSILPDQEKILIDKKIYQDALSILQGNFIEKSFGRKTFYQFTPKYKRTIDYIVMKLPHEQHNFRFAFHDYKELLIGEAQSESYECISDLIHKGKIYAKLDSRFKAIQCFEKAIKCGTEELNNFNPSSHIDPLISQQILISLDCVCEAYIEVGLIENHVGNNKRAISYFWTGIRTLLEFYENLLGTDLIKFPEGNGNILNGSGLGQDFDPWCQKYIPENNALLENIIDCTFTETIFNLKRKADAEDNPKADESKIKIKEYNSKKEKLFEAIKEEKDFLSFFRNDCEDLIQLLGNNFKNYIDENNNNSIDSSSLTSSTKSALKTLGFEDTAELSGNLKHLRNFSDYLRIIGFRLKNRKTPIFYTPKLLYCINSLSSIYSKMGQFHFALSLLKTGLNVSDQTSFKSNAIIQRLQLAMFCLLRSEYINAIQYYRTVFHHLNKEKFFNKQAFYMDNRLLAGIFDMVSIFQNTLYPFPEITDGEDNHETLDDCINKLLSVSSQTYYLKEKEKRKAVANKLKMIKAFQHRALDAFYLVSIQTEPSRIKKEAERFFCITKHTILNCKDVLSIGRKGNPGEKVKYTIVRNTGEALMRLGEICLYYGRAQKEFYKLLNTTEGDSEATENFFDNQFEEQEEDLKKIWDFVEEGLDTPENYSLLSFIHIEESDASANPNAFYCLSEKFLRFSDKLLSSFYTPEALTIPQRLGNVFYFVAEEADTNQEWEVSQPNLPSKEGNDFKKECLHVAKKYYSAAIKGFKEYQDFDHEEGEWLAGAYSDLGNVCYRLSELESENLGNQEQDPQTNTDIDFRINILKKDAINNYKESLRYIVENMNELFATLTGKGSKLNVSLDSLFDTDYAFDILKKFSRRIISQPNENVLKGFPSDPGWGFTINTAHIHDIAKYLNQCLISAHWENNSQEHEKIDDVLNGTGYLSNTLRSFGGTIEKESFSNDETPRIQPHTELLKLLNDPESNNGEMRDNIWPIGGYRYIVVDYDKVRSEIESFKTEYIRFRGMSIEGQPNQSSEENPISDEAEISQH